MLRTRTVPLFRHLRWSAAVVASSRRLTTAARPEQPTTAGAARPSFTAAPNVQPATGASVFTQSPSLASTGTGSPLAGSEDAPGMPREGLPSLSLATTPWAPKVLGFAGLLPFIGTTVGVYSCVPQDIIGYQLLQATYGASILSFMGAVHWGLAMAQYGTPKTIPTRYYLSVIPALTGFVTLNLPPDISLLVQAAGFQGLLLADIRAWKHGNVPRWYPSMRIWLSMIVTGCLCGTWYAGYKHGSGRAIRRAIALAELSGDQVGMRE
ncbi:hypothetical protein RI367_002673 [Sorochytrium milnesiophthora]